MGENVASFAIVIENSLWLRGFETKMLETGRQVWSDTGMDLCTSGRAEEEKIKKKKHLEIKLVILAGGVYVKSKGETG